MSALNTHNSRRPAAQQQGFTLLEVLIALVIFSVGLLGIAGLQMTGMKQTHNSHLRSVATTQVLDMADRMRANPQGVEAGNYSQVYAAAACPAPTDCASNPCTPAQLAHYDVCEWRTETTNALPGSTAVVCLDDSPAPVNPTSSNWIPTNAECSNTGNIYAIKIQWRERALDEDDQDTLLTTNLRHFFMRVTP